MISSLQRQHHKRGWLIGIPLVGIALIAAALQFGRNLESNPYHYRLPIPVPGTATRELEKEVVFLRQRIELAPNDGLDRAHLAKAYLKMARATGNIQWYLLAEQSATRSLNNLAFNNLGAVIVLARIAEAKHDFPEAIKLANQVLKSQPNHDDALSILVSSNLAIGKLTEAEKWADKLATKIPSLNTLSLRALVKSAQGKDREAIQDFQQAIASEDVGESGSSAKVRAQMGRFYFQRGNFIAARQLYGSALQILPRYPLALVYLAELETRQGDYQAAEKNYTEVYISAAYPNTFDHAAWYGRGQVRELQGDRANAEAYWLKAQELLNLHSSLSEFGHRREAAKLLLVMSNTENKLKDKNENLAKALSLMEAEVKIRRDAETLETYAWVLIRLQRWQTAQKILQEAIDLGTRNPTIFYRAAQVEEALGNQGQAIALFQKSQAIDPTFSAYAKLAKL
jgi:tetratricopeptide (TPR) repeat protein